MTMFLLAVYLQQPLQMLLYLSPSRTYVDSYTPAVIYGPETTTAGSDQGSTYGDIPQYSAALIQMATQTVYEATTE